MSDGIYELHLNSSEGLELTNGNEKADIIYKLKETIAIPTTKVQLAVVGGKIPRTFYTIDDLNCQGIITIDGTPYPWELSHGNPQAYQIATDMIAKVNAATGLVFTVTYVPKTNKYTISHTQIAETAISLSFPTNSDLFKVLGFTSGTHAFTLDTGAFTLTSDIVGTIVSIPSCSVNLEGYLFDDAYTISGKSHILQRIYFKSAPNGYEIIELPSMIDWKTTTVASGHLASLHITMRDSSNRNIDFNGVDYELTLYIKPVLPPKADGSDALVAKLIAGLKKEAVAFEASQTNK